MKNNNQIGQELPELTPVELVGYEDKETGNPRTLGAGWFTPRYTITHRTAIPSQFKTHRTHKMAIR